MTKSSEPSATENLGQAGTSTSEGPSHAKVPVPSDTDVADHKKQGARSGHEVPTPGPRVDDEHDGHGDKRMTRQD